jgi:hypothetical protein
MKSFEDIKDQIGQALEEQGLVTRSCNDRIDEQLSSLEGSCADLLRGYYDGNDEGIEEWNSYPLAVSTRKETKIELSYGGPSDFLTVSHDGDDIYTVTYHFQDWFDGATRAVDEGSKVWEYAQTVISAREECGY